MRALLLVAHGSRREEANDEVRRLGKVLASYAGRRFQHVACGFLEYASPRVAEGIGGCVAAGAREVVVLPYFLTAGDRATGEVATGVEEARRLHTAIEITLAPYAGSVGGLVQTLLSIAD